MIAVREQTQVAQKLLWPHNGILKKTGHRYYSMVDGAAESGHKAKVSSLQGWLDHGIYYLLVTNYVPGVMFCCFMGMVFLLLKWNKCISLGTEVQ